MVSMNLKKMVNILNCEQKQQQQQQQKCERILKNLKNLEPSHLKVFKSFVTLLFCPEQIFLS